MVNRRSESLSSAAHFLKESETDSEGIKSDDRKGVLAYSGFPKETQLPQPFAPHSPNRGCSDSQNSSSESRSASVDWPTRDCGTWKALYHMSEQSPAVNGRHTTRLGFGKGQSPAQ